MSFSISREIQYYLRHPGVANFNEMLALKNYIESPSEITKEIWLQERLKREKRKYLLKGILKEKWPKSLQNL